MRERSHPHDPHIPAPVINTCTRIYLHPHTPAPAYTCTRIHLHPHLHSACTPCTGTRTCHAQYSLPLTRVVTHACGCARALTHCRPSVDVAALPQLHEAGAPARWLQHAFDVASNAFGAPKLLDAADMIQYAPGLFDLKSMQTYSLKLRQVCVRAMCDVFYT